ncbi:MAG TPA: ankyrin repeat domain-containing protein [Thermoanaerobaculia bacterium]|nr:ankyrin repeat domain-containing protein [Thermoanaerobaculia bacterium]
MKQAALAIAFLFFCSSGHAAMSKAEAKKLLAEYAFPETPDGILIPLNLSMPDAPRIVEAYLVLGARADQPVTYETDDKQKLTRYPLNYLLMFACSDDTTAAMAKLLVDAGADPNTTDPENDWAALSQAYACPDVQRVLLAAPKKANVNRVDRNGATAMHLVIRIGHDRKTESVRMLLDAGFDLARFRAELLKEARYRPEVLEILSAPPKIDWKSVPPYPQRTASEATKMLERPGAATTIDEHMWDGVTHREPLRLALALAAGANVRQTRAVTNYTPLILLTERCDLDDPGIQTANAELLLAAGADKTGVDANGADALVLAAGSCPVGVVRALIAADLPLQSRSKTGATALRNAITKERADVVEALLAAGVDPKKEPYNVRALASGNKEIEALLKKKRR